MKAIQIISQDLFDKVRSRFQNLEMGDETGAVTIDPAEARFFDFDFVNEGVNLGRVSISLNELGSLKIYYSQGITENQDDPSKQIWYNFLKEMRLFSMRRLLRFDTRDVAKSNLDKNDFKHLATTQAPKEDPEMNNMNEIKKIKKSVAENTGRELTNTPRDRLISRMSPSVDNNALLQKVGKVVNSPEFDSDNILKIVDAGDTMTHPVGRYIQKEFDELQYDLGREYEDHPEEVAEKLLSMLKDRTQQPMEEDAPAIAKMAGGIGLGLLAAAGAPAIVGILGPLLGIPIAAYSAYSAAKIGMSGVEKLWDMATEKLGSSDKVEQYTTAQIAKLPPEKAQAATAAIKQVTESRKGMAEGLQESRWNQKSSKKTSRAVKGATEVIVRHHKSVDEMYPGARSQRKNIRAIYIQNSEGERFKYPFIHPAGAFAMAQHVDHGGAPHDPGGKAIVRMSEQIAQLQEFQRQVQHTSLHDDAMGITERAVGRLQELKSTIEALGKRHHYESWISELTDQESGNDLMELDPITMETYKAKFTQSNFKEELASFFPLIHSIMQETNTVDLEDFVKEATCPECHKDPCECDDEKDVKESMFAQFEEWAEATEQGKLTDDEVEALKTAMSELPNAELELGPDGQTAWQFFSGLGLTDSDLEDKFKAAFELDPSADPIEVLKMWAQESYPELLVALGLSGTGETEPAPEPAPEAPPMDPMAAPAPEVPPTQPVAENNSGNMIQEVAKIVKSFYNRDNPDVGPFRGGEGIALDVEKQIAEKFGDKAGQQARQMAEQFMEKLTMEWQQRHGTKVDGDDGLARLKELLGNVKQKVEGMGQTEMEKEGMMDKAKAFGKKVLDKVAPDDDELLRRLQRDSGVPKHAQHGKPPMATPNREQSQENTELESILKLSGIHVN